MEVTKVAVGVALALLLAWLALLAPLLAARPNENVVKESLRLLLDLVRLVTRLAKDGSLPRGDRIRLALLLAYLACPIDLVPEFVPALGYADDLIAVVFTLRSLVRITVPQTTGQLQQACTPSPNSPMPAGGDRMGQREG